MTREKFRAEFERIEKMLDDMDYPSVSPDILMVSFLGAIVGYLGLIGNLLNDRFHGE